MSDDITRSIAGYGLASFPELAPELLGAVQDRIVDSVGVAVAAFGTAAHEAATRYAAAFAGSGTCTIWGSPRRVNPEVAAFVNGVAIRTLDYNDSYFSLSGLHPSDMLGGLIAVAEGEGASGHELIEAVLVAYEVGGALADTFEIGRRGWDQTNLTGIAACVGVGRLIGLGPAELAEALAITIVPHVGTIQTRAGAVTMWKCAAGPEAVRHAVYACSLARAGFKGPLRPFEGSAGFIALVAGGEISAPEPLEQIARCDPPRRVLETHLKAWPCGHVSQSGIAAAIRLRDRLVPGEAVQSVEIHGFKLAMRAMGDEAKRFPYNRETADHSLPYIIAASLLDGDITLETFDDNRVTGDRSLRRLLENTSMSEDAKLTERYPQAMPIRVRIVTSTGRELMEEVDDPPGSANHPFTRAQLRDKFLRNASRLGSRAEDLLTAVSALTANGAVTDLTSVLKTEVLS